MSWTLRYLQSAIRFFSFIEFFKAKIAQSPNAASFSGFATNGIQNVKRKKQNPIGGIYLNKTCDVKNSSNDENALCYLSQKFATALFPQHSRLFYHCLFIIRLKTHFWLEAVAWFFLWLPFCNVLKFLIEWSFYDFSPSQHQQRLISCRLIELVSPMLEFNVIPRSMIMRYRSVKLSATFWQLFPIAPD